MPAATNIPASHTGNISFSEACDLPTEIHPILARENWVKKNFKRDAALWEDLQPALQFTTQMLTDETALLWWTHLLFGQRVQDPLTNRWFLIETEKSWNPAAVDEVKDYLTHKAAGCIKLAFSKKIAPSANGDTRRGLGQIRHVLGVRRTAKLSRKWKRGEIVLVSFQQEFKNYFATGYRRALQDLSTSFLLGITIVHEIAHAVNALMTGSRFFAGQAKRMNWVGRWRNTSLGWDSMRISHREREPSV